jgi:hypothetical protein
MFDSCRGHHRSADEDGVATPWLRALPVATLRASRTGGDGRVDRPEMSRLVLVGAWVVVGLLVVVLVATLFVPGAE